MELRLYNTSSAHNVVHKNMTLLSTLDGELKENCRMETVTLNVNYFEDYYRCNYAYIPEFHRYYYVNVALIEGAQIRLMMKSDPLTSFYDGYKNSKVIARRSTSNMNPNIPDNRVPFKPTPVIDYRRCGATKFTPSTNGYCYVLILGGK